MLKEIFSLLLVILFSSASAAEDCKIKNTPYDPQKTVANHRYPVIHLVKGNTVLQSENVVTFYGFQPELAFSKMVSAWEKLVVVGLCPNKPTSGNICKIVPLSNNIFGLKYNDGPVFLTFELDFILEKQKELISRGVCVNAEPETPDLIPPAPSVEEELPVQSSEETQKRFD